MTANPPRPAADDDNGGDGFGLAPEGDGFSLAPGGDGFGLAPESGTASPVPLVPPLVMRRASWDDGLIARRAQGPGAQAPSATGDGARQRAGRGAGADSAPPGVQGWEHKEYTADYGGHEGYGDYAVYGDGADARGIAPHASGAPRPTAPAFPVARTDFGALRPRLDALRELVGLSRTRLDRRTLAEAGRVLEEAAARQRHSLDHTVVALAGATGSGKSTLFNCLAGARLSEAGVRRPTTCAPLACAWTDHAGGLLDRLRIPAEARLRPPRPYDPEMRGLVLVDLPDHDSAASDHREQVDRLLGLVDAVIWVVDPEKYADAVLHERYLRPLAGYAEVTFVVLNQVDRLPGDAADHVLDDLRRLLDEDGLALGEHGDPGAAVLALSALTGEGVGELRELLGQFAAVRGAAERRLAADVDGAAERLRSAYVAQGRAGLTEAARAEFEERLAEAVGAAAAGQAAERAWLRAAGRACGTPWARARRRYGRRQAAAQAGAGGCTAGGVGGVGSASDVGGSAEGHRTGGIGGRRRNRSGGEPRGGRVGAGGASRPTAGPRTHVPRPAGQPSRTASRPMVEQAVRTLVHGAAEGLPAPWAQAVREAAGRGAEGLAEALDEVGAAGRARGAAEAKRAESARGEGNAEDAGGVKGGAAVRTGRGPADGGARPSVRPGWWAVAAAGQWVLFGLHVVGALWLLGAVVGWIGGEWWVPAAVLTGGGLGGPVLAAGCRVAARGPARGYGLDAERRLRNAAAGCGRARVLEPVAAELLRYREVREQYVIAAGPGTAVGGV
ncbi:YfjP family GTPase [Streptomyces sp. NPDC050610]|uniref:YfjP family GTPase n=1 Tax=Streptomyces sp. NPDC050610 TaxID=3157097 RepID=UPI0034210F3C